MNIKKIKSSKGTLVLEISGITSYHINALRRYMLSQVPTIAIEICRITKNSSALYDEILAHRLGLIPLKTDLSSYSLPTEEEKSSGEYSAKSSVKMTLSAKGPCIVYASDIESKDPKVKPVYPDMIITKLLQGQEIEIEMTAVLGKGQEHMKWSPGLVFYRNVPKIHILKNNEAVTKVCPTKVFSFKGDKLNIEDASKCILCRACEDIDGKKSVQLDINTDIFTLIIESWGQLKPETIFEQAIEIMNEQLAEVRDHMK